MGDKIESRRRLQPESKMKELLSGQRIVIQRIILAESTEGNF